MEHAVDAVEVERLLGKVEAAHVEPLRIRLFLGRVVVVGEAVDADDLVARRLERACELRPDEAPGTRDDVSHRGTIPYTLP